MQFGWADYGVLALLLCLSTGIGLYQGCIRSKQLTTNEFLIGEGRMGVLPTAMSLLASAMSAATLLGLPAETYTYGTMYLYCIFTLWIAMYLNAYLFIPKFRQIGSVSIYAYLEQRFSLSVRIVVTFTFVLVNILYMAVILYGPSLALSQVTGLNIWLAVGSCGFVCTLYTSIGGMKAVIWTDVIQVTLMFSGIILSIIFGFIDAGGIRKVLDTVISGNRLQLAVVTLDPSVQYTVWNMFIGNTLYNTALFGCLQTQAQRYMCVSSTKAAQKTVWINYGMCVVMIILCQCAGCLIYVKYSQCDPLRAKLISRPDQLYPLFVTQILGRFPGLAGLFIACILSASLSTISSGVNSMAAVILEDIYKRISTGHPLSDQRQAVILKFLSASIGLLIVFMAFMVSFMKSNIIVIIFQLIGSFVAPILGLYILGFFAPRVNHRSALVAFLLCLTFQLCMLVFATLIPPQYKKSGGRLPTSVDGCSSSLNASYPLLPNQSNNSGFRFFSISSVWYSFNGFIITIILGLLGTFIFGSNDSNTVDKSLLSSWRDIFPCCSGSEKKTTNRAIVQRNEAICLNNIASEQERML